MRKITQQEADQLVYGEEYASYIMDNCHGIRIIGNGHDLLDCVESLFLWKDFLDSKGLEE